MAENKKINGNSKESNNCEIGKNKNEIRQLAETKKKKKIGRN